MSKKIVKLICLLAALFCLVSCSKADNGGTVDESVPAESFAPSGEINMAFVQNDTLSPYEAKTKLNLELGRLMYDGLVKLGNGFEPSYVLASDISLDGTVCVVTINPAAKFTDGNAVTADDVVYSVSAAKAASQSKYSSKLENVSSCTARDALTVVFNLNHTDEYFVRLLDFPIFEKETEKQVNSDNKSVPPIGSGRYVFGQQNDKFYLEANQNWIGGWLKKGWKRGKNEPVKNVDLWKRLLEAKEPHNVTFIWVKGHDGHPQNERCDELATSAADAMR